MKSSNKNLAFAVLTIFAILGGAFQGHSQTTVIIDPTQSWQGYMNVFAINPDGTPNYGAYQFGSPWGTTDLRANFNAASTNTLTLTPCTNVWETGDTYWVQADGVTPNKWMDASFYVQNDNLAGQTVTFNGTCLTNSFGPGYTTTVFVKDFASDYSYNYDQTTTLAAGQSFSISLTTTAGDHIQYGFETQGLDASPASFPGLGNITLVTQTGDPSVPPNIAGQAAVAGQTVTFNVTPIGTFPFYYQWQQVTATTTNVLANGGRISGATTGSLTISNVLSSDAGTYSVTVTNSKGSAIASGSLVLVPLAVAQTNLLVDPSFESGAWGSASTPGWINFNGAVFQNSGNFYYNSATPVSVLDGTNCVQIYPAGGGSYNGVYQDRPASPGQIFTASANFYTPSQDQISGANICYMEVHFMDAAGNVLVDYSSALVTSNTPANTWVTLQPTNIFAGDFTTPLGKSSYLKAPANTAKVRTQATYFSPAGASGSVFVDLFDLRLRSTVVTPAISGSGVQLSFPTLYGPTYQVLYKTNLTDAAWQTLATVVGDGTVKTVADPVGNKTRFYTVNTQ